MDRERLWVEQIRGGDRKAFEALFHAYAEDLCLFVWRYVKSKPAAEELIQDLFLRIWTGRQTFCPSGAVKAYLFRAARNRAFDHLKHQRVVRQYEAYVGHDTEPHTSPPDEDVTYRELLEVVEQAIEHLPERRRLIFLLYRQHGMSYREIAETLDISVKTVDTQLQRAVGTLRETLVSHLFALLLLISQIL